MVQKLTAVQQRVLECVREGVARLGYPPTFREIAKRCGITSVGSVHYHIEALKKHGYLLKDGFLSRGLRLAPKLSGIPILGRVAAGMPALAQENVEGYIQPADFMIGKKGLFALRVRGDSMVNAGILDGDIAIVREQSAAYNKDIVVALLGDEATIKYFYREGGRVRLEPANPNYRPIISADVKILGKVVKIVRNY